jgi:plasmid stability protein
VAAAIIAAMTLPRATRTTDAIVDSGGDAAMAQLIVRNIEASLVQRLKERAARNGRSAEAEHREILRAALAAPLPSVTFKELLFQMPDVGEDEDFERAIDYPRDVDL